MVSFVRVTFMLVFHQNKRISSIMCTRFYYRHVCTLLFFHVLGCFLLLQYMLAPSA